MNNKQAIEVGEELLEHSKKDIPYHKRKEGVTEALSHLIDLAKAYESASKELPEKAEHSKDCLYVIAPHYVGNKSKEKYCTCGAFDNNYALDQAQLTVTKLKMEIEELNEEIDKQIDKYTWLEGDKYQLQQQLAESRELQNKIIEGGKEITKLIRENEELREKVRELDVKRNGTMDCLKIDELQQRIATLESRVGGVDQIISLVEEENKQFQQHLMKATQEVLIQVIYEEMYPPKENTADELCNRKEKAMDKYLGRNQGTIELPILKAKVDTAMAFINSKYTEMGREKARRIHDPFYKKAKED